MEDSFSYFISLFVVFYNGMLMYMTQQKAFTLRPSPPPGQQTVLTPTQVE